MITVTHTDRHTHTHTHTDTIKGCRTVAKSVIGEFKSEFLSNLELFFFNFPLRHLDGWEWWSVCPRIAFVFWEPGNHHLYNESSAQMYMPIQIFKWYKTTALWCPLFLVCSSFQLSLSSVCVCVCVSVYVSLHL